MWSLCHLISSKSLTFSGAYFRKIYYHFSNPFSLTEHPCLDILHNSGQFRFCPNMVVLQSIFAFIFSSSEISWIHPPKRILDPPLWNWPLSYIHLRLRQIGIVKDPNYIKNQDAIIFFSCFAVNIIKNILIQEASWNGSFALFYLFFSLLSTVWWSFPIMERCHFFFPLK